MSQIFRGRCPHPYETRAFPTHLSSNFFFLPSPSSLSFTLPISSYPYTTLSTSHSILIINYIPLTPSIQHLSLPSFLFNTLPHNPNPNPSLIPIQISNFSPHLTSPFINLYTSYSKHSTPPHINHTIIATA